MDKVALEKNLKTIKDAKLEIEILKRENEKLCEKNNQEIASLQELIQKTESILEEELKKSGEKKLECKIGYCSLRTMPDKWEYQDSEIITWCKKFDYPYYKTIEVVKRQELKKDIQSGIINLKEVPGVKVITQEPKFNYKIRY